MNICARVQQLLVMPFWVVWLSLCSLQSCEGSV